MLSTGFSQDPVVIEITDTELSSINYHQNSFDSPTKLVFSNLSSVEEIVYFHQNVNLVAVEFPQLTTVGSYVYFHGNEDLESISAPILHTVRGYLYANQNSSLEIFDVCALTNILIEEDEHNIPYYSLDNNTPAVDDAPCFSQGPPENLSLSNTTITENSEVNTVIGTFSAEGNYPENTFTYFFQDYDSPYFFIEGNQLKAKVTFDFEVQSEFSVYLGVYNQLGETQIEEFIITVEDVENEGIQTIEILEETLPSIYYHQENYTVKTKLVFPNLTSVDGIVYFHQNVNLVSVEFPKLNSTGDYFYFHGNQALESLTAPVLETVHNYLYINLNGSLMELDVCALKNILPFDEEIPYYSIANNTTYVDQTPFCFSQGPPSNISITGTSIEENSAENSLIGTLNAEGYYPENDFTFFLDYGDNDNESFVIVDNELRSGKTFDYESQNEYIVDVSVHNQIGELTIQQFTITIQDIQDEGMQTIEILDETLESLFYHQENFTAQTRLVFPNLTRVNGIVYFHQNINLTAVHLPKLSYVGEYMYFHGNEVIDTVTAPTLDTVHQYLYASQNHSMREFDVCSLTHILPDSEFPEDTMSTYYYVQNNNSLDFSSTCLDSTILEFQELDSLVQSDFILAGSFISNTSDPIMHTINVDGVEQTETDDFIIIDNGLYLRRPIEEYTEESYPLSISSLRMDSDSNTFLNEQILLDIILDVKDKAVITSVTSLDIKDTLSCFPNPTNSEITIKTSRPGTYSLTNQFGEIVMKLELQKEYNTIDLSQLPPSLYYLKSNVGPSIKVIKF